MRLRIAIISSVVIAVVGLSGQEPSPAPAKARVNVGRSKVATRYGIVAASQPLSAQAGVSILEHGGNAVDAAIAANAVEGVVEPHYNGIGGDLFVMYYEAKTGKLYGLNSGGWAASGETAEFLRSKGQTRMPQSGVYSITVPGAVKGWEMLRSRFAVCTFSLRNRSTRLSRVCWPEALAPKNHLCATASRIAPKR